jgi:flavodoxin
MPEQAVDTTPASEQETGDTAQNKPTESPVELPSADNTLVVYFSATGTTRGVAEKIAALTDAELVEIVPAQPYTTEDLNYNDRSTRATVEQNTPDVRPEIANEISLEGYTTVYLGYPIWWGQAPRILSTFVEGHDFTGITVIPFCTSGGSGAGRTGETLGEQAGSGTFLSSTRFSAGVSEPDLQKWIESKN